MISFTELWEERHVWQDALVFLTTVKPEGEKEKVFGPYRCCDIFNCTCYHIMRQLYILSLKGKKKNTEKREEAVFYHSRKKELR